MPVLSTILSGEYLNTKISSYAIAREKRIKGMLTSKKLALIKTANPLMSDLSADWYDK